MQTHFSPVTALTRHVAVGDGVVHVWERELFPHRWSLEGQGFFQELDLIGFLRLDAFPLMKYS